MVPRGRDLLGSRVRDLRAPDGGLAAARRGAATRASLAHARASEGRGRAADRRALVGPAHAQHPRPLARPRASGRRVLRAIGGRIEAMATQDRKSTRLKSSYGYISYAVFCLKKKKTTQM